MTGPTDYDPADGTYTQTIPSGVKALRVVIAERWTVETQVVRDASRCAQQSSEHCECRAIDCMTAEQAKRRAIFDAMVRHAELLGVQSVIADRRVWGFGIRTERAYHGVSPHTDHTHVGLNLWAAHNLTVAYCRSVLDGVGIEEDDVIVSVDGTNQTAVIPVAAGDAEVVLACDRTPARVRCARGYIDAAGKWQGAIDLVDLAPARAVTLHIPSTAQIVGVEWQSGSRVGARIVR